MKKHHKYILILLSTTLALSSSCTKFIEIPASRSQIEPHIVFADSSLATSALLGVYLTFENSVSGGFKNLGLYADEYSYTSTETGITEFNKSRLSTDNYNSAVLWNSLYSVIYQANAIIAESRKSNGLSQRVKIGLEAEAQFLRAYAYFYLVNTYDRVPLILTPDVNQNKRAGQAERQQVYGQIIKDLQAAKSVLGSDYKGAGKSRANALVASALLARVYLYQNRWDDAEKESTAVISSRLLTPLPSLENVFLSGSSETIFQFWNQNGFIEDAAMLIPATTSELPLYAINQGLYHSFEDNDSRADKWIGTNQVSINGNTVPYHYPAKYKNRAGSTGSSEYLVALRLSEQYLIRAEAFAQQNNIADAIADLNVIRDRAGLLPLLSELSKEECLDAVAKERRLELFGEWGHRFFDLKRTRQLDAVMSLLKPTWLPRAISFPIPKTEILYNSNLIQNHGY